jgi:LmbE family N-acetylglucosaminyl deacetylase
MDLEHVLPKPDLLSARNVLAIQPHYDDNDISAGGTIASLVELGAEVYYLTVTDDLVGVLDEKLSPQAATQKLHTEQKRAGLQIGVKGHYWLNFPDASPYDHFDVRKGLIQHIRLLRPDFILTVDPFTPYEAHTDHIRTGKAAAEATILYSLMRLKTDPEVDASYQPHEVMGIAFYNSWAPNTYIDITQTREKKHRALNAYEAQFSPENFPLLHMWVEIKERMHAENCDAPGCTHAEGFKVLSPRLLHGVGETWKF